MVEVNDQMTIYKLLNLFPQATVKNKKKDDKAKLNSKNKLLSKRKSVKMERLEKYDVVTALTQAQSGLIFGTICQVDAFRAKK